MLAFKRSSLAASEEQDNVLSCSSCVPHPKVNRLPSPYVVARARTPTARPIGRAGKAEWGKSRLQPRGRTCGPSGCESTESLPRQTSRRTDVFLVCCLSSVEISCRSVFSSFLFFFFRRSLSSYARRSNTRVWYIAPKRTVRWRYCRRSSWSYRSPSYLGRVGSDLRDASRVPERYSRDPQGDPTSRSTPPVCVTSLRVTWTNWCRRQPDSREDIERGARAFVLRNSLSLQEPRKFNCVLYSAFSSSRSAAVRGDSFDLCDPQQVISSMREWSSRYFLSSSSPSREQFHQTFEKSLACWESRISRSFRVAISTLLSCVRARHVWSGTMNVKYVRPWTCTDHV